MNSIYPIQTAVINQLFLKLARVVNGANEVHYPTFTLQLLHVI